MLEEKDEPLHDRRTMIHMPKQETLNLRFRIILHGQLLV